MRMKKLITDFVWDVYRLMQRHYITFHLLMWLKERGIMRNISYRLWRFNTKAVRPEEAMRKSREFFSANADRSERVLSLLADDKSKIVWGGSVL